MRSLDLLSILRKLLLVQSLYLADDSIKLLHMLIMHLFNLFLAFERMRDGSVNDSLTQEHPFILLTFVLLHSILKSLENHDALIVLWHAPTEVNLLKLRPLFNLI